MEKIGMTIARVRLTSVVGFIRAILASFIPRTFFTRLHHFVIMSDAYIVAPGGIGTVLEAMMIWQLLQVRQLNETPLIFAGPMGKGLVEWASVSMLRSGFELANTRDMQLPHCVERRR
jgi:predicted Rossmann-fold nucleotide-binding protein